jgi:hypothetical protein
MKIVTIPKKLASQDDLIVIPRKEYEALLRVHKKHKDFYDELDRDLNKAIDSYAKGKVTGPFTSIDDLKKSLKE